MVKLVMVSMPVVSSSVVVSQEAVIYRISLEQLVEVQEAPEVAAVIE